MSTTRLAAGDPAAVNGVPPQPVRYVGLTTRAIAFAMDAAIINVAATIVGVGAALILSILHLPKGVKALALAIGGAAYILWILGYFIGFWSTGGQTPGNRVMRLRVVAVKGEKIKPRRALLRCIGLVLAALPLFAGYALIPFDSRRRGLQDRLARTLVVEAPELSIVQQRREQRRQATRLRIAARQPGASSDPPPAVPPGRSPHSGDERVSSPRQS